MINEQVFRLKKNGEPYWNCFCRNPELIENYDKAMADTTKTWECHHKDEELYTKTELINLGLYFDLEPEKLVFVENTKEHYRWPHKSCDERYKKQVGRKVSEETKAKIAAFRKGKHLSDETKAKIAAFRKGKHLSDETKAKISATEKGKKVSEETKAKMSKAHKTNHKEK